MGRRLNTPSGGVKGAARIPRLVALAAAAAVVLAGCGTTMRSSAAAPRASAAVTGRAATATPAADLRAELTYLLTEHVYRAGIALKAAVDRKGNLDDPAVKAAVANLDANSVELSKAIGSVYPQAEQPFLASWREHIGMFVNYTLGKATHNQGMVDKARTDLDGYRTAFAQLIHSVVPELPVDAVAADLVPHVQTLEDAIDALVAGDPSVFAKFATAASHMPMTAATLSQAIATDKKLAGSTSDAAATLRAGLTYLLTSHVDLAAIALSQAVGKGGNLNDVSVKAAVSALDANSVDLSTAIGSVYPQAEQPFLASWREHIGMFVNYTLGKATHNQGMVDKARTDLDGYRTAFAQLIHSVVPELPTDAVAADLVPHVKTLEDTIDALVAGDTSVYSKLSTASAHMPMTAATLAGGVAADKNLA